MSDKKTEKSTRAFTEEETLSYWKEHKIFEKSLEKNRKHGKEFVFYEGPPTANAKPALHHLEARAFKDVIPRYKTMRGFNVPRKGGWDTHGLPVEIQVEKALGLKSKKEIEKYGIAAFNQKCKENVWEQIVAWRDFTERMGYWVDLDNAYVTYRPKYMESLWSIIKHVHDEKLLYKDYKVVPWCPRCGTALSSHELAQGYEEVKDLAVTVKFKVKNPEKLGYSKDNAIYFLAWTTTPWTLPGNVALAIGKNIQYVLHSTVKDNQTEGYILAADRLGTYKELEAGGGVPVPAEQLLGLEYEPLYPFTKEHISGAEKEKMANAYKVYAADFVTTEDGTGIVHTAVMYGQDDFELGNKVGLPKFHLVNDDGTFKKEAGFLAGKFVKPARTEASASSGSGGDEETNVDIIKDLAHRGLLFAKEKYAHSYPFCWRCHTPLIYFARDSWYIKMSALREKLIKENEKIHWEPDYIKEGRFGEWLREVKDWAISRERYWGTPLPVWVCGKCGKQKVAGSVADIETKSRNKFFAVRHGESENNVADILSSDNSQEYHLTERGKEEALEVGEKLKKEKVDVIVSSPFVRTKETAEIIAEAIGYPRERIVYDDRLRELGFGVYSGKPVGEYVKFFNNREEYFTRAPEGGETRLDAKKRIGEFLRELDAAHNGKRILIVSHEGPIWMMVSVAQGLDIPATLAIKPKGVEFVDNAEVKEIEYREIPRNGDCELDLHRPYIDEVKFACDCGGEMRRVKEVMDVWFDSGSMPFAQAHYPFEKEGFEYPSDFISEAIDQTRGWFYTLHAVGNLMGKGAAFKNVICLGLVLDADGKKMSKSVGNVVEPFSAMDKYGADALRFWMYSVNAPGESKNFDERTVDEVVKKVFNLASNVLSFYLLYAPASGALRSTSHASRNVLDRWILARLSQTAKAVTGGLEQYDLLTPTRALRDFIADLSQWYIRRSRERFKGDDEKEKQDALSTTKHVLLELSKLMAPFTPFFAEHLYRSANGEKESVHLEDWPAVGKIDNDVLAAMLFVRSFASMALMERARHEIKVRQPLNKLSIKHTGKPWRYWEETKEILADEVNVKEVVLDSTVGQDGPPVKLDVTITSELKKEGDLRELIRQIQDLRKQKGLKPGEPAVLATSGEVSSSGLLQEFESEVKKTTALSRIEHGALTSGGLELK